MEASKPKSGDRKWPQKNWTQADREFIKAAIDGKTCVFTFFSQSGLSQMISETPPAGIIKVVDMYFMQIEFPDIGLMWIAKSAISAIVIP